jgi:hypothetical protein
MGTITETMIAMSIFIKSDNDISCPMVMFDVKRVNTSKLNNNSPIITESTIFSR